MARQIFNNFGRCVWDDCFDLKWRLCGIYKIPFESIPGESSQRDRQLSFRADLPQVLRHYGQKMKNEELF